MFGQAVIQHAPPNIHLHHESGLATLFQPNVPDKLVGA